MHELSDMESTAIKDKTKEIQREKPKTLKLTFKEKIALETLPQEIDELEVQIEEKNECLANPECYEEIGISKLAKELEELENIYEQKVEELLNIEEKNELIGSQ